MEHPLTSQKMTLGHSYVSRFLREIWSIFISCFLFLNFPGSKRLHLVLFFTKFSLVVLIKFVLKKYS